MLTVSFVCPISPSLHVRGGAGGLHHLNAARQILGEDIETVVVEKLSENPTVPVPESMAQRAGWFDESASATVHVAPMSLNRYVTYEYSVGENDTAYAKPVLNLSRLLYDWENAGFPQFWKIPLPKSPARIHIIGNDARGYTVIIRIPEWFLFQFLQKDSSPTVCGEILSPDWGVECNTPPNTREIQKAFSSLDQAHNAAEEYQQELYAATQRLEEISRCSIVALVVPSTETSRL